MSSRLYQISQVLTGRRLAIGWSGSLALHLMAVVACASYLAAAPSRVVLVRGDNVVPIQLEVTISHTQIDPPIRLDIELEVPDVPIEIEPLRAKIFEQRFVQATPEIIQPLSEEPRPIETRPDTPRQTSRQEPVTEQFVTAIATDARPRPERTSVDRPQPKRMPIDAKVIGVKEREPPTLINNPPPTYPELAISQGLEGVVHLRMIVAADGTVTQIEVAQSSGHDILDRAAIRAVQRWEFEPGRRLGQPVESTVRFPVRFVITRS